MLREPRGYKPIGSGVRQRAAKANKSFGRHNVPVFAPSQGALPAIPVSKMYLRNVRKVVLGVLRDMCGTEIG